MNDILWKRMRFKGNKVWLATGINNKPKLKNGKVLIKYQLDQKHEYWVHEKSIQSLDTLKNEKRSEKKRTYKTVFSADKPDSDIEIDSNKAVLVYTDGASSGNPGHSGIGVFFKYKSHEKELSKYIGIATNNIAELEAIRAGLLELKETKKPVRVITDSNYAYGLLVLGWKAKKNIHIVQSIKKIISNFNDLKFIKVRGHAGDAGNERADFLATSAIKNADKNKG